jgi:hypothetical protein
MNGDKKPAEAGVISNETQTQLHDTSLSPPHFTHTVQTREVLCTMAKSFAAPRVAPETPS